MIVTIFGKPRAGKSTLLASVARRNQIKKIKYYKRIAKSKLYAKLQDIKDSRLYRVMINAFFPKNFYDVIYSTDPTIHYTVPIDYKDLGKFPPTPNSLYMLEEAGVGLDGRRFKDLTSFSKRFAAIHGHNHVDILIVSQSVDIDKAYRQRSELMYIAKKFGPFTILRKILYAVDVDEQTRDLVDAYTKVGLFGFLWEMLTNTKKHRWSKFPFAKSRIIYRPAWYKYFNSYVDDFDYPMEDPVVAYAGAYEGDDPYLIQLKKQAAAEAAARKKEESEKENEEDL